MSRASWGPPGAMPSSAPSSKGRAASASSSRSGPPKSPKGGRSASPAGGWSLGRRLRTAPCGRRRRSCPSPGRRSPSWARRILSAASGASSSARCWDWCPRRAYRPSGLLPGDAAGSPALRAGPPGAGGLPLRPRGHPPGLPLEPRAGGDSHLALSGPRHLGNDSKARPGNHPVTRRETGLPRLPVFHPADSSAPSSRTAI